WERTGPIDGLYVKEGVSDAERLAAIAACDVLLLPSAAEAFGIVYLEAWAYSKPVIGSHIAPIDSLITHMSDGLLVDPLSVNQIAEGIRQLADNTDLASRLGKVGRQTLENRYT